MLESVDMFVERLCFAAYIRGLVKPYACFAGVQFVCSFKLCVYGVIALPHIGVGALQPVVYLREAVEDVA